MSTFVYVHHEDLEITVKVQIGGEPLTSQFLLDAVRNDKAAQKVINVHDFAISRDGKTAIVGDDELSGLPANGDVFLVPRPVTKPRDLYVHVFAKEADEDPIVTVRRSFEPPLQRDELLSAAFAGPKVQSLMRDPNSVKVTYIPAKGQPSRIWQTGTSLNDYPVGGDVMVFCGCKAEAQAQSGSGLTADLKTRCKALEGERKFAKAAALLRDAAYSAVGAAKRQINTELAMMWLDRAGLPERAVPLLRSAAREAEGNIPSEFAQLKIAEGRALFNMKKFEAASQAFTEAVKTIDEQRVPVPQSVIKDLRVRLGASLFATGKDQGIQLIQETLGGDVDNTFGVMWMSRAYATKGHPEDALQWAVQLVVRDQNNLDLKRNFVHICGLIPDAVRIIKTRVLQTPKTGERAMAWGFLGQVAREYGSIPLARELFAEAHLANPSSAGIALNYIHVFEQLGKPLDALQEACKFLTRNPDLSLNGLARASDVAVSVRLALQAALRNERKLHTHVVRVNSDEEVLVLEPTSENHAIPPLPTSGWDGNSSDRAEGLKGSRLLRDDELSLGAIYFTIVKVLYCMGCLHVIPQVIEAIEPGRRSEKFSRTLMKNEHSYYQTVCESMQWLNRIESSPAATDALLAETSDIESQLFVCGDSHSLPLSWQRITLAGRNVALVNKLVTGLKIWHMRDECDFYPKFNFEEVVKTIPEGSDVLFCFGEIDCREGILKAVEKGVYENAKEGFVKILDIYVRKLAQVKQQRKLRHIFVHCAFPVLNLTRHIVAAFNTVFSAVMPHVTWLLPIDTTADLLTLPTEGSEQPHEIPRSSGELRVMKAEFALDHTHINPTYVPKLLEAAMNAALDRQTAATATPAATATE